jgi:antitoxin (DNA-binding transcriptional repressor) of toxin-antitoxin stability system
MKHVGLLEAQGNLATLCREVALTGCEFIIEQDGVPLVRLVPIAPQLESNPPGSVWDAVRAWDATHGEDEVDFDLPSRSMTHCDPLG